MRRTVGEMIKLRDECIQGHASYAASKVLMHENISKLKNYCPFVKTPTQSYVPFCKFRRNDNECRYKLNKRK